MSRYRPSLAEWHQPLTSEVQLENNRDRFVRTGSADPKSTETQRLAREPAQPQFLSPVSVHKKWRELAKKSPEHCDKQHGIYQAFLADDIRRARELQRKACEMIDACFQDFGMGVAKAALQHLGFNVGEPRRPLRVLTPDEIVLVVERMDALGLSK